MKSYEIFDMIIDNEVHGDETVTADFTHDDHTYSITFNKADLELINLWVFDGNTSLPASLSDQMIDSIREDVKKRI